MSNTLGGMAAYYDPTIRRALWVYGYTDNSLGNILEEAQRFADHIGVPIGQVWYKKIRESSRFKHAALFEADCPECPEGFIVSDNPYELIYA